MIETKHFGEGSAFPRIKDGLLRLYSMRFCPFAQRIQLVLNTKKIPFELINVNLSNKPAWLFEKSPLGKVPALELDGQVIFESLIVADAVDEKYPGTPMYPSDPFLKAKERLQIEAFSKVSSVIVGMMFNPANMNEENFSKLLKEIDEFEKELEARGGTFFGGDTPNMVDLMIWPFFERFDILRIVAGESFSLPSGRYPKLSVWIKEMKNQEGVKATWLAPEVHAQYLKGHLAKNVNFDMLVKS